MKKVLSTKRLNPSQRELLLGAGMSLVDYNAIKVSYLDFDLPSRMEHALFTSQNGVRSVLQQTSSLQGINEIFCVGNKTAQLCVENGGNVTIIAKNAEELTFLIQKKPKINQLHYFCSESRLDIIPDTLNNTEIELIEVKSYKIEPVLAVFEQKWDGILFFSPSGVQSFYQANPDQSVGTAFCLGETTATEARKFTKRVLISNSPTTESLIAKTATTLRND